MTKIITMQDAIQTGRSGIVRDLRLLMEDERGDALAEYAIISAIFAVAMLSTMHLIANETGTNVNRTATALTNQSYMT